MKRLLLLFLALAAVASGAYAKKMSDLKIYINPGHGGYTSNDRPIRLHPYAQNDTAGYWESTSNLYKGLHMYHILDSLGAKPYISRIKNTEADDRSLSGIAAEANNLGVDLMFSIHSNAGEAINFPLMLYREETLGVPRYEEAVRLSKIVWKNLYSSQLPVWTRHNEYIAGDLTFYDSQWKGGLGVLRTLYVVGLLSEGSMHEHRPEAHRLMNDDVWWLEAWHFVRSIMEFYDTEDRFVTGNVAGIVYDSHNLRETVMPCNWSKFGRDRLAPLNGTSIELVDAQGKVVQTRTTDNEYNGAYVFRNVSPGTYTVRARHDGYYDMEKTVVVTANEVSYQDMALDLKREFPLEVVEYGPIAAEGEKISCASVISFTFNTDVDAESFEKAFSIEPAIEGYLEFTDSYHKATFRPNVAFAADQTYTVKLASTVRHPDPNYANPTLGKDLEFSFTTVNRNRLEMLGNFPAENGEVHIVSPSIEFRFDAPINPTNIFDVIDVRDSKGTKIEANRRSSSYNKLSNGLGNVIYVLSTLTEGETYTATLTGDIRDRENIPMVETKTLTFKAVDITKESQGHAVINGFEASKAEFAPDEESSTGMASKPSVLRSNEKLFGNYAVKFNYKFADRRNGIANWVYTGSEPIVFNHGDELGLHINGDFSGHEVYAVLVSGTDVKYASLGTLDYRSWAFRSATLDMLEEGYPYIFSGIRLVQVENPASLNGSLTIDNLTRKENSGVVEVVADQSDIKAWPVPATDYINVESAQAVERLDLYNAAGARIRTTTESRLNVTTVAPGIYFLTVTTAEQTTTLRVVVK